MFDIQDFFILVKIRKKEDLKQRFPLFKKIYGNRSRSRGVNFLPHRVRAGAWVNFSVTAPGRKASNFKVRQGQKFREKFFSSLFPGQKFSKNLSSGRFGLALHHKMILNSPDRAHGSFSPQKMHGFFAECLRDWILGRAKGENREGNLSLAA